MKKIVLAGLLGGLTLFIWSALSHTVLGLGGAGMSGIPPAQEAVVLAAMRAGISQPGFYFFPWMEDEKRGDGQAMKAWEDRYRAGPRGVLVYHPQGTEPMMAGQLVRELASNIVAGILVAWLAVGGGLTTGGRWTIVALVGLVAAIETNFSYWNWYGFPRMYTVAQIADIFIGYTLMGVVIALLTRGALTARTAAV